MTIDCLKTVLESSGIPVVYDAWPKDAAPPMPYIVYSMEYTRNFYANNIVYLSIEHMSVDLYTDRPRDLIAEGKLETVLQINDIAWQAVTESIPDQACWRKSYEFDI